MEHVDVIPMERWGKDHWSTFAYVETCAVEGHAVDADRMRTHPRLHFTCLQMKSRGLGYSGGDGSNYPTRLKDGEASPHDDWSCVEDMIAEGLLEPAEHKGPNRMNGQYLRRCPLCNPVTGLCDATYKFTPTGFDIAHQLREHKANGGNFTTFVPAVESATP